jgi:hypothetical protein
LAAANHDFEAKRLKIGGKKEFGSSAAAARRQKANRFTLVKQVNEKPA